MNDFDFDEATELAKKELAGERYIPSNEYILHKEHKLVSESFEDKFQRGDVSPEVYFELEDEKIDSIYSSLKQGGINTHLDSSYTQMRKKDSFYKPQKDIPLYREEIQEKKPVEEDDVVSVVSNADQIIEREKLDPTLPKLEEMLSKSNLRTMVTYEATINDAVRKEKPDIVHLAALEADKKVKLQAIEEKSKIDQKRILKKIILLLCVIFLLIGLAYGIISGAIASLFPKNWTINDLISKEQTVRVQKKVEKEVMVNSFDGVENVVSKTNELKKILFVVSSKNVEDPTSPLTLATLTGFFDKKLSQTLEEGFSQEFVWYGDGGFLGVVAGIKNFDSAFAGILASESVLIDIMVQMYQHKESISTTEFVDESFETYDMRVLYDDAKKVVGAYYISKTHIIIARSKETIKKLILATQ